MGAGEEQGQGRQENGACVLSRETAQHPFEFQDFKGESVTFLLQVLHISAGRGGFLLLFVCWAFGSACRPQWGCSSLLVVERGLSSGAGECWGVSERLAQLPPSPLG